MSDSKQPPDGVRATPASDDELPSFDELAADPEIAALLDFEPVPRKRVVEGAWTPELQREFIVRLAVTGSVGRAAEEMGKTETGVRKLYRSPAGASFRAAWEDAIDLAKRRLAEEVPADEWVEPGSRPPSLDARRKYPPIGAVRLPGQVLNEHGEWEDEGSIERRGEEAKDRISNKLLMARRLYLFDIADSPGKRAAFEILADFPVDWDKARNMEAQIDEPFRMPNMRRPDMLLTAENGWLGEMAHGPDKMAELRRALDEHYAAAGLPPIEWGEEGE